MNVKGKFVLLRAIERSDLELLAKWSNDPDIQYMLGGWHTPSSHLVMDEWLKRISSDPLNLRFAIDHEELGLIGTANLVDINWKDKNAFHGMLLGDKDIRGKGIGVDVVFSIMRYAFEELGLNRLDGSMIDYNEPSKKLYLNKCGWKIEGTQRGWYWRKNQHWDKVMVGVTRDDYFKLIKETDYWNQ
jgi:RimJ/RimL family protein N-acetyltransferase